MNKDKIKIALKTLKLLENISWKNIQIEDILEKKNKNIFKNKKEFLININLYFDYLLKKNVSNLEKSSTKDMLFEVLMARFDILNLHRKSVKGLIKYFLANPQEFISLLPSFVESIILISSLADINVNGIKGAAKIKIIFLLYVLTIFVWNNDDSPSLEKTMTSLDKYLNQIDKFVKLIK